MLRAKYKSLLIFGLLLILGTSVTANANGKDDKAKKRPKNTGVLSVKTAPEAYPVTVDGVQIGMSGVQDAAEFYLAPGTHRLEIGGPNGKSFVKDIEIVRDRKNCICLRIVENVTTRACPYNVSVQAPDNVKEGDIITFVSVNAVEGNVPLTYRWTVFPETARITSGVGTPSITVDTTGMGNQTVTAELDVTDDVYGATCQQRNSVRTTVERVIIELPKPRRFDEFESRAFDDDKARLDNFVIELQNNPDAQGYIIMYQGTDRASQRRGNVDMLSRRTLDYLVKTRGVDPRRIMITKGYLLSYSS